MTRCASTPAWVDTQHKTMLRWLSAKLAVPLTDLSADLDDGLVLIQLVNKLVLEMNATAPADALYHLQPLYRNPKFKLQKTENVTDMLDFVRLVLKINVVGISAERIVEGDLKSILGLLWTLFVFSSSTTIGKLNEGNSILQVKQILLNWLNGISKLVKVSNFDRDWSIEVSDPGLTFEAILNKYLPLALVPLDDKNKKLQNLTSILDFAAVLGIPKLADVDDFVQLVPDEKCILFYLIEWYKFFELDSASKLKPAPSSNTLDDIVHTMDHTIHLKYEYETKALRHLNKINSTLLKFQDLQAHPCFLQLTQTTNAQNAESATNDTDNTEMLRERVTQFTNILHLFKALSTTTDNLSATDIPELTHIHQRLMQNLRAIDSSFSYEPSKSLHHDNLCVKMEKLIKTHNKYCEVLVTEYKSIVSALPVSKRAPAAGSNDSRLDEISSETKTMANIELHSIQPIQNMQEATSVSGQRMGALKSQYLSLKERLLNVEQPLTYGLTELCLLFESLTSPEIDYEELKSFISFIPTKRVHLAASDSDFSLVLDEEDEEDVDHSKLIFENNRKRVNSQLTGNNDRVYDMNEFFIRFEDNLRV